METTDVLLWQTAVGVLLGAAALWLSRRPAQITRWVGLGIAIVLCGLAPMRWQAPITGARTLRVLSVLDNETTDALVAAFEAKTEIRCLVDPFAGGASRSADLLEDGRLQPDVMLGGTAEVHDRLADAGKNLAVHLEPDSSRVSDHDDPDHRYTPIYLGYLALVHRPLPEFETHPPAWTSLIEPRWSERVSLPAPTSTSGGIVFLATQLLRQPDEERGWTYLQILGERGVRWEQRSNDVIARVASGKADLGVAWAHDTWRRVERDRIPVGVHVPDRTGYEVGAVSVFEWVRDRGAAEEFVKFLTSAEAQRIQAEVGLRIPLRTDVPGPPYVSKDGDPLTSGRLDFFDRSVVMQKRNEWIERWRRSHSNGR